MIRVSVVELPDNRDRFELAWPALIQNVDFSEADVLVLPELPASPWFGLTRVSISRFGIASSPGTMS